MTPTRRRPVHVMLLLLALCSASLLHAEPTDVRVLVDVSGSMKHTDPQNLRVPALRLLGQLLPEGTRAAAWLFCETVEPLLPAATVDAKWKRAARDAVSRIHSRGQFTDIELGVKTAIADWPADPKVKRHLILLTDGMVDVAKDSAVSAASKARLEGEVLASLKAQGIRVHTIALSATADHDLLSKLAGATEGWSEQVADAASLQRVFLHMFEQAAAPDSLPIKGNTFTVDASVRELTVLVFHAAQAEPLKLTDPAGNTIAGKDKSERVRWQAEAGYDLVTIDAPAAGKWRLNAKEDPDNRVLIVSDLQLALDELPASTIAGDGWAVRARLTEKGRPIERRDFLQLVKGEVALGAESTAVTAPASATPAAPTPAPAAAAAAVPLALDAATPSFGATAGADLAAGEYEVRIKLDGGTFTREKRHRLRVLGMPVTVKASTRKTEGGADLEVTLEADGTVVKPETLTGALFLSGPDGVHDAAELPAASGGSAKLTVPLKHGGEWRIAPWVLVDTATGRTLKLRPPAVTASADIPPPPVKAEAPTPPPPAPRKIEFGRTALVLGIGNAGLGALLGGAWFFLRRRQQAAAKVALS